MTTTDPTPEVLAALLQARGIEVPTAVLTEIAPAVRDMWELGDQLERDLAVLGTEAS